MKTKLIILFLIFTSNKLLSQVKSPIEVLSSSVAYLEDATEIETIYRNGKKYEIWLHEPGFKTGYPNTITHYGSSFFVSDSFSSCYLITAAHIARFTTFNTTVVIKGKDAKPSVFKLKDLANRKDTLTWTYNESADVATLLLDNNSRILNNYSIDNPMFMTTLNMVENYVPNHERELIAMGFPLQLGYKNHFSPITKISRPSSEIIEMLGSNNKMTEYILLDDPGISGFSGSAVLQFPKNGYWEYETMDSTYYTLIGLVSQSIQDKLAGGGFTAIVPSKYIIETINKSPKFTGSQKIYHLNGKIWTERVYNRGRLWNVIYNYNSSGNKVEVGNLKDGNGTVNIYDEDGKLERINNYVGGRLIDK